MPASSASRAALTRSAPTPRLERPRRSAPTLTPARALLLFACLALAACARNPNDPSRFSEPTLFAVPVDPPASVLEGVVGTVELPSGPRVHWAHDFNRNALVAARAAGDGLVALTDSGHLLRFDLATMKLAAERASPGAVRCLGSGPGGAILAGVELPRGGRVVRVDPRTLALTTLAELDAAPVWVGADARGVVAVVERLTWVQRDDAPAPEFRFQQASHEVVDVASGARVPLREPGTAFLLDRKGRLWVGSNGGEFGRWLAVLDAARQRVVEPAGELKNIYGFFEQGDEVFAYGGQAHGPFVASYVAHCTESRVTTVASFDAVLVDNVKLDRRPYFPISHLIAGGKPDELLAVSGDIVWRTDPSFTRWAKVRDLERAKRPGRDEAVLHHPPGALYRYADGRLLLASRHDGLVRLAGERLEWGALPGQFEASPSPQISAGMDGVIFVEAARSNGPSAAWRREGGAWTTLPVLPPGGAPGPGGAKASPSKASVEAAAFLVGFGGGIFAVAQIDDGRPGRVVVTRWQGGRGEIVGRGEGHDVYVPNAFLHDGEIWASNSQHLHRFKAGAWEPFAPVPTSGSWFRPIAVRRPPWPLLERNAHRLFLLDPESRALPRLAATDGAGELPIEDAVVWSDDALLLATWRGLFTVPRSGGAAQPAPFAAPGDVTRLASDHYGRIWLGGEGLWVYDRRDDRLHALDALPLVGGRPVLAMAPDPNGDGVVVVFGGREHDAGATVALVRLERR